MALAGARRLGVTFAALWMAGGALAEPVAPAAVSGHVQGAAAAKVKARHWQGDWLDVAALGGRAAEEFPDGAESEALDAFADRALQEAFYGFAEREATQADGIRYALPYDASIPRTLVQGVDGERTHTGREQYGFDFLLPMGWSVRAARSGVVARIVDGFPAIAGSEVSSVGHGNEVLVLHGDGTFASYRRLSPEIGVREGERVSSGRTLGRAGSSGPGPHPYLHFAVYALDAGGEPASVPIEFGRKGGQGAGYVPERTGAYGNLPRSNHRLIVTLDGENVEHEATVELAPGDAVQLAVGLKTLRRGTVNVTENRSTHFSSLSPQTLYVDDTGLLTVGPAPGFEGRPGEEVGRILVLYVDTASKVHGVLQFAVRVTGP